MLTLSLVVASLTHSRHYNWKQSRASGIDQFAHLKCAPPLKHLMRVHALGLSNPRYTRSRQKRKSHNPTFLCNAPAYPIPRQSHANIVYGKHKPSPEGMGIRLRGSPPSPSS